jgi:hypothetical protein
VIGSAVAVLLALGAGWLALVPVGLGFCALGWILRECAALLARIDSDQVQPRRWPDGRKAFGWLLDALVVALAGWASAPEFGQPVVEHFFPAFMLVALLRILPLGLGPRPAAWLEDRAVLALGLAVAVLAGYGNEAIHLAAATAALAGMVLAGLPTRLTRP